MPLPIRESELLDFTYQEWAILDGSGMETYDLPPQRMGDVFALKQQHGSLSANDCICLVTAQCYEEGILLTGDALLRNVATEAGVRVRGVLWVIDELKTAICFAVSNFSSFSFASNSTAICACLRSRVRNKSSHATILSFFASSIF